MADIVDDLRADDVGEAMLHYRDQRERAAQEIERLRSALRPFAAGVFNDNGDVTISRPTITLEHIEAAYWSLRRSESMEQG